MPLEEALTICRQIALGLEAAHEKGVTHRDLKPANIKVTPNGTVKVLDFGLAKINTLTPASGNPEEAPTISMHATQVGMILGTAAYMSPEQAKGKPADKRADIWAFGVVLHELLTGERLFMGETVTDTLAAVVLTEPKLAGVPPQVRRLLKRCLEKDPQKRLRDIGDAMALLEEPVSEVSGPVAIASPPSRLGMVGWVVAALHSSGEQHYGCVNAARLLWCLSSDHFRSDHSWVEDNQRTPIRIGKSSAKVVLVQPPDGPPWIEKSSLSMELEREVAILNWCAGRLPVPKVIAHGPGSVVISVVPGVMLTDVPVRTAVTVLVKALNLVHSLPIVECPFDASWESRLKQGEKNILAGLIDESDFDDDNAGRSPSDILAELRSLPPLPELRCFTHGDACLPNFLSQDGELAGVIDLGRAGVAHPAQDWALALRSVRGNFGSLGEQLLREHLPTHSADEEVLRRFRLLDELF